MGLFRKNKADEQISTLRAELAVLRKRLDDSDRAKTTLENRLSELTVTNGELQTRVQGLTAITTPPPAAPPPASGDDDGRIASVEEQLAALEERTGAIDARVTSVATELTNQLSELSNEIDGLSATSDAGSSAELDELRDGAERLANEQARYQIQFRQDLADLAERLRRTNPT